MKTAVPIARFAKAILKTLEAVCRNTALYAFQPRVCKTNPEPLRYGRSGK
jgi:hypothetical protein